MILLVSPNSAEIEPNVSAVDIRSVVYMPSRRSYESAERLGHLLLDATPIFGVEPCEALLASPFRPRLGVRSGWSPFPKDSSYGQTTR
jgi:hypothetical protein